MSLSTIQAGDRIRLVTYLASTTDADGGFHLRKVSLRYSWIGPDPEHLCVAEQCEWCDAEARRLAARHLKPGHKVIGVSAIRDRQATMIDRRTLPVALPAAA